MHIFNENKIRYVKIKNIMKKLFLHVGPGKTGTTFLQEKVFGRLEETKYIPYPKINTKNGYIEFGNIFLFSPHIWEDDTSGVTKSLLEQVKRGEAKTVLVSSENIHGGFGFPPNGWIEKPPKMYDAYDLRFHDRHDPSSLSSHLYALTKSLKEVVKEVGIIFTIRRQDKKIASEYAQISDRVWGASQSNFSKWVESLMSKPLGYYKGGGVNIDYYKSIKEIEKVVGKKNLLVTVFENMKQDIESYVKRILMFLNCKEIKKVLRKIEIKKVNSRSYKKNTWGIRPLDKQSINLPAKSILKKLGLKRLLKIPQLDYRRGRKINLTPKISKSIMEVFSRGNKKVDKLLNNKNIKKFGYY
jgi:hypothetical protein